MTLAHITGLALQLRDGALFRSRASICTLSCMLIPSPGTIGLLTGGIAAVLRASPTPTLFTIASSIQWFALGSTFWGMLLNPYHNALPIKTDPFSPSNSLHHSLSVERGPPSFVTRSNISKFLRRRHHRRYDWRALPWAAQCYTWDDDVRVIWLRGANGL